MSERNERRAALSDFLHSEVAGGAVLLAGVVVGLVWANMSVSGYEEFWHHALHVEWGPISVPLTLHGWVNDGLMTIFFFVVGLEIKRELVVGELRDPRAAALPVVAAAGGMLFPIAVFIAVEGGLGPGHGTWAVPIATDVAFVLGALALLASHAPPGLRLFLLTLAIADDIGGIIVIAFVGRSSHAESAYLLPEMGIIVLIVVLQRVGVRHPWAYVPVGAALWYCTLRAGIHPTIAGVLLGLFTPARPVAGREVLTELEHRVHPWSAFVIVPLFAIANAGVHLGGGAIGDALSTRLAWAVLLGLVIGKPLGITTFAAVAARTTGLRLPNGLRWPEVAGGAALAGIGFTVSLFIAGITLGGAELEAAKIAILGASLVAATTGAVFLLAVERRRNGSRG